MNIERNYIESNWLFDISFITASILLFTASVLLDGDQTLFQVFSFAFILIVIIKTAYNWKKIQELKSFISLAPLSQPDSLDHTDFYDLDISIKEDSIALDIFEGKRLKSSFKKAELKELAETACLVILKTNWWNWNWRGRDDDNYFQLLLLADNKTIEILRIKETSFKRNENPVNIESVYKLANTLGSRMKIKIKDCAQHRLSKHAR